MSTQHVNIIQPRVVLDDPHACTDSGDVLTIFGGIFDALVRRGKTGWEPCLATNWHMSDDARTTTFQLREAIRFHDGQPCDAAAIKHCLERMARPDMGATLGAPGVYSQYLTGMTVTAHCATSLSITTVHPLADILDIIGYGHIVSPRALADAGDDLMRRAVGTGPCMVESYEPGKHLTTRANPSHFAGAPRFGHLSWLGESSAEHRQEALLTGRAQAANALPHQLWPVSASERFSVQDYLSPTALILMFNSAEGPGADPLVRRALNLAIDRQALVRDVLHGAGQPLHGFISPVHDGFDADAGEMPFDRDDARRLLSEAGYGAGLSLNIYCPTRLPDEAPQLVDALEAQLAGLGVSFVRHMESDRTHYANQVRLKQIHDICVFDSSPMSAFRVLYEKVDSRVKGSWWEGYCNVEVEALLDRGRSTVDPVQRRAVYAQAYRLLQRDPPWIYVYNHVKRIGLAGQHPGYRMRFDGVLDVCALPAL